MNRIIPLCFKVIAAIIAVNPLLVNASKYILIKIVDEEKHAGNILDMTMTVISYDLIENIIKLDFDIFHAFILNSRRSLMEFRLHGVLQ